MRLAGAPPHEHTPRMHALPATPARRNHVSRVHPRCTRCMLWQLAAPAATSPGPGLVTGALRSIAPSREPPRTSSTMACTRRAAAGLALRLLQHSCAHLCSPAVGHKPIVCTYAMSPRQFGVSCACRSLKQASTAACEPCAHGTTHGSACEPCACIRGGVLRL